MAGWHHQLKGHEFEDTPGDICYRFVIYGLYYVEVWQIDGETVAGFILGGSKITADGDCSHEIKRCLLLGRKIMTNLDSILKKRHYFANKGSSSQGYGFSSSHVWM